MTTFAIYSNKGGVGKTAAAVNLGYLSAAGGRSTLICDLDPQAAATFYLRVRPELHAKAIGLHKGSAAVADSIKGSDYTGLDILPADFTHRELEIRYSRKKGSTRRLAKALGELQAEYDVVILDCPPSIGLLAENIFAVSDYLLTPLVPTTLSLRTYAQLKTFLREQHYDSARFYTFLSMVDRRKKMHQSISAEVQADEANILPGAIPYTSVIEQMGIRREPVPYSDPSSPAAIAYKQLWRGIEAELLGEM
ncbi:MAG: ParA family protein [Caldilineaceae bacterium]|nr:ParA family protein [Caldilineaceae bacterium]